MRMSGHVDGHAGNAYGKICSVVQVEAAQEILIRFTVPAMLSDDQAGNIFQDFTRAERGAGLDSPGGDCALARGIRNTYPDLVAAEHLDFWGNEIVICCRKHVGVSHRDERKRHRAYHQSPGKTTRPSPLRTPASH